MNKSKCEALAAELGVTILVEYCSPRYFELDTPAKRMFNSTISHTATGEANNMKEAWELIWQDLQSVTSCEVEDCELCDE